MTCANCNKPEKAHARGLCRPCYLDPDVRFRHGKRIRHYTAAEVARVKALRAQKGAAGGDRPLLGRNYYSIASLCSRFAIRTYRLRPEQLRAGVQRLFRPDRSDAWIGKRLGCTPHTVYRYRARLGLLRELNPGGLRFPRKRPRAEPVECWACGAVCPLANHIANAGWVSRRTELSVRECYCAPCYQKWGWPDAPKESTRDDRR